MTDAWATDGQESGNVGELSDTRAARLQILVLWQDRVLLMSRVHYQFAETNTLKYRVITLINMFFAITVLFLANTKLALQIPMGSGAEDIAIALASLGTVLTVALQYLLRYEERALNHKFAANEYSDLSRKIERYISIHQVVPNEILHSLNREINYLAKISPMVSARTWKKVSSAFQVTNPKISEVFSSGQVAQESSSKDRDDDMRRAYPRSVVIFFEFGIGITLLGLLGFGYGVAINNHALSLGSSILMAMGAWTVSFCIIEGQEWQDGLPQNASVRMEPIVAS